MSTHLILGCHGWKNFGFTMCRGTQNEILNLDQLGDQTELVLEYLDKHCKLYDSVSNDHNKVLNAVHFVLKFQFIPEHMKKQIYEYIAMHKHCGCYLFIKEQNE